MLLLCMEVVQSRTKSGYDSVELGDGNRGMEKCVTIFRVCVFLENIA